MAGNRHGLTGAPLEQPDPAPLRRFAMYDAGQPCTEHAAAYTGRMPCTGDYRCWLCGTCWDEQGRLLPPRDWTRHAPTG